MPDIITSLNFRERRLKMIRLLNILKDTAPLTAESQDTSGSLILRIVVIGFIIIVVFLIIFSLLVFLKPEIFRKKTEDEEKGVSVRYDAEMTPKVGDTKSFLPYKEIKNNCIDMGNYNYRAIIEVSSINYGLMSATEQQMVDASYRSFLDSLDFPIEIYIQTREFDYQRVVDDLEDRTTASIKKYPQLEDYCNHYIYEMSGVTAKFGNSKIKKKYVIVPFDQNELQDVSELSVAEINTFAQEELMSRCSIVVSHLESIGLSATLLDRSSIAECLYSYYHRDSYRIAEDIVSGSLNSLVINGPDHRVDDRQVLDSILSQAQNSIKNRLVKASSTDEELMFYKFLVNELEKYKQDDRSEDMANLLANSFDAAAGEGYEDSYYDYVKKNPEAKFWNLPEKDYNNGKITIPEWADASKSTLGNSSAPEIKIAEFEEN